MAARSIYPGGAGHSQNLLLLREDIKPGLAHVVQDGFLDTTYSIDGESQVSFLRDTGATLRTGAIGIMRDISVRVLT